MTEWNYGLDYILECSSVVGVAVFNLSCDDGLDTTNDE